MQTARNFVLGVAFVWGTLGMAATSQAQFLGGGFGPFGGGLWNQSAFGVGGNLYGSGYIPVPPYYSIHPPVYYSGRVFRPYGDSPYAYWPERFRSTGSYFPQASEPEQRPQLIMNPFFSQQVPLPPAALPPPAGASQPIPNSGTFEEKSYSDKSANPLPSPKVNDQTRLDSNAHPLWTIAPPLNIIQNPFVNQPFNREEQIAATPKPTRPAP